jgi:hypothetical protein
MKIGDLVKHPKGMENVCKEKYALGVVLQVRRPPSGRFETQVEVLWHPFSTYLIYNANQLEVISYVQR